MQVDDGGHVEEPAFTDRQVGDVTDVALVDRGRGEVSADQVRALAAAGFGIVVAQLGDDPRRLVGVVGRVDRADLPGQHVIRGLPGRAPRIHAGLAAAGLRHGRKRIAARMREARIRGRSPRRWKTTTIPHPHADTRPDLVDRGFGVAAAAADTRWCGDITYISTWEGWLYLATVIDGPRDQLIDPVRRNGSNLPLSSYLSRSCVLWQHTNQGVDRGP